MTSVLRWLAERAKRKHNAYWVQIVWMEPMGASTWCVWDNNGRELSRSPSLWRALWEAGSTP
jgi:hypothetical protein